MECFDYRSLSYQELRVLVDNLPEDDAAMPEIVAAMVEKEMEEGLIDTEGTIHSSHRFDPIVE